MSAPFDRNTTGLNRIVEIIEGATICIPSDAPPQPPLRPDGVGQRRPRPPFAFKLFDQIDPSPRKDWLVRGMFGAGELSVIYGDPGCGKSVLATDLAFHIATGVAWHNRAVSKGAVVYVAAERSRLTERRLAALRAKHELAEPSLAILDGGFDLFSTGSDHIDRLISTVRAVADTTKEPVALIIIDTVARVIPGADENSARDIGRFAAQIEALRRETGAHVLLIHHAGKDKTKGMRGSSALLGAADTTVFIEKREDGARVATIDKANDEGEGESFAFTLESVELFVDPETKETTTAPVVVSCEPPPATKSARGSTISAIERNILDCLDVALDDYARAPPSTNFPPGVTKVVHEDDFRRLVYQRTGTSDDTQEARRKRFKRAVDSLIARKFIAKSGEWFWRVR